MSHNTAEDHSGVLHQSQSDAIAGNFLLAGNASEAPPFNRPVYCAYKGPSMNPTITENDLLEIIPYSQTAPGKGDVILFVPSEFHQPVIHRIIGQDKDGYITRGDNCSRPDPWRIQPVNLGGRVCAAHRRNKKRTIPGGVFGRLTALRCHLRILFPEKFKRTAKPLLKVIHSISTRFPLFLIQKHIRVICFQSRRNPQYKLVLGSTVIGMYNHTTSQWNLKRPYQLVFNQSVLPEIPE